MKVDYKIIDKILHWVALDSILVRKVSFELERILIQIRHQRIFSKCYADSPVYICGLARTGTTLLLEILSSSVQFASLTYRDMPFVLSPNLWKIFNWIGAKKGEKNERAHGDGVFTSYDSAEAFEEIFWKTFTDAAYIKLIAKGIDEPSDFILKKFAEYRFAVISSKIKTDSQCTPRYLSKNNSNIIRVDALVKNSSAKVLLVYRDPFDTSLSLLRQHKRFVKSQYSSPFILKYMNWLGHHEFGLGHVRFFEPIERQNCHYDPMSLDYWLDYYCNVYEVMANHKSSQISLIHYDSLCCDPLFFLGNLFKIVNLNEDVHNFAAMISKKNFSNARSSYPMKSELIDRAYSVYKNMLNDPRNVHVSEIYLVKL